jgi:two-component system, NtrC family, sensor histidine kinase HydH
MSPTAEQFAELAELAGGFIHEIKNHISTLGLNLQILAEDFADPQSPRERKALERVQRLQHECERLIQVSNDFMRFARAERLRLEPTAKQKGIAITWYPGGTLPPVMIDRDLFKQALLNLLLNAEQAMPGGGEITLQAGREAEFVRLDLIDTGCGIADDMLKRIFKPFHTTKPGGTGLGLPTTRKIIQAHGGKIEVQSEEGRGTKVSIRLPIKDQELGERDQCGMPGQV